MGETISNRIAARRVAIGLTQKQLVERLNTSERLEISLRSLQRLEAGARQPTHAEVSSLVNALETIVEHLRDGAPHRPPTLPAAPKEMPCNPVARIEGLAPPPPDVYLGRAADADGVVEVINRSRASTGTASVVVHGIAGIGKTAFAAFIASDDRMRSLFPGGVLWTALDRDPDPLTAIAVWGRSLGNRDLAGAATVTDAKALLRAELLRRPILMVVDDVWSVSDVRDFVECVCPGTALLMTSRTPLIADAVSDHASVKKLDGLELADALDLLQRIAGPDAVRDLRDKGKSLVEQWQCHPLAIQVGARLLRRAAVTGGVSIVEAELKDGAALMNAQVPPFFARADEPTLPSVRAVIEKSTQDLDPEMRRRFQSLCRMSKGAVEFTIADAAARWGIPAAEAREVAATLFGHGLAECRLQGHFSIHALLAAVGRSLRK